MIKKRSHYFNLLFVSLSPKTISFIFSGLLAIGLSMPVCGQRSAVFQWLVGKWEITTGKGIISETWQISDDSTLMGKSVFIKNGRDTIPQEMLKLAFQNGEWNYISRVTGQNNDQSVSFRVIYSGRAEFISENPTHDYPQRISYRKISDQFLYASIEGSQNGKYGRQNFDFNKR